MKIIVCSEWHSENLFLRNIQLIPSIQLSLYLDYKFESFRIEWLGFMIGFYKED